ncbi:O-antigen ligase domain-containing protein [Vreelandella nanhaiensis]|uniref:O-antigen ligase domain-containing protein n=2 Tax=Vreelandella nanhaiensis TaxID=1258546 RepID=A0A433KRL2_9GAMM|nr:O-antigen ligase domain-containing protein [Halomonas nanhaiensis]
MNTHESRESLSFPTVLTDVAVFLLAGIALIVPSGYSLGAVILMLAGISLLIRWRLPRLTREDWQVVAVLCAYTLVGIAEAWLDGQGSRGMDKPLRFVLAVPALWWVIRYPPRLSAMWAGIAVGGMGAGGWAGWQKLIEGVERAQGHTFVIQFGNLSMLLGVLCLAGLGWAHVQRQYRFLWITLLLIGFLGGMLGSLFSGSRGGWVGFPFVLLVLYRAYGKHLAIWMKLTIVTTLFVGGIAIYLIPQTGVQERVQYAVTDIEKYISGENRSSSLGARFEMWRGASHLIMEKPLTGWGAQGYTQAMQELGEKGVIDSQAAEYGHAHNEFIDAFAKRGLLGLIVLLGLYLVPMRLFARKLKAQDLATRALATAGVLLSVTYIDFGLSQAFLNHNSGVMMYAFMLVVLWGTYVNQKRLAQ